MCAQPGESGKSLEQTAISEPFLMNTYSQKPSLNELIAYCEKYIADLKKEIANGNGDDWMHESIRMEEAIVEILKSNRTRDQLL